MVSYMMSLSDPLHDLLQIIIIQIGVLNTHSILLALFDSFGIGMSAMIAWCDSPSSCLENTTRDTSPLEQVIDILEL